MNAIGPVVVGIAAAFAVIMIVALFVGLPVMWLWNSLVPDLFHGPTISFWQAVGLFFLTNILFNINHSSSKKDD